MLLVQRTNDEALQYFVQAMREGKIEYRNGELWRMWELRRGWLQNPRRAERLTKNGYYMLRTVDKSIGRSLYVMAHRVVWSLFNGNLFLGAEINHINGVKADNRVENLEQVTHSENHAHAIRTGLWHPPVGLQSGRGKLSNEDIWTIRNLLSDGTYLQREIASMYGVRPNQISRIKTGARHGSK